MSDGNRLLDTLFFGLMAAQAAIYAIILDKFKEYPAADWELLLGGFILATLGTVLTVFVREAPSLRSFVADLLTTRKAHDDSTSTLISPKQK